MNDNTCIWNGYNYLRCLGSCLSIINRARCAGYGASFVKWISYWWQTKLPSRKTCQIFWNITQQAIKNHRTPWLSQKVHVDCHVMYAYMYRVHTSTNVQYINAGSIWNLKLISSIWFGDSIFSIWWVTITRFSIL